MQKEKSKKKVFLSYVIITLGLISYSLAWTVFLLPNRIVTGGVTGMSAIIYFISGDRIPVGVMNFFFNAIFLLIGIKYLGPKFGVNTIYGIVVFSALLILWQQGLHLERVIDVEKLGPAMCAIIGGSLCGLGIGLAFIAGGNSGGTDIIALVISKYHNISPGKVIMAIDILVIGSGIFLKDGTLERVIIGYIVMLVMTYVIDLVVDGNKQTYQIMVFSDKVHELSDEVAQRVGRGSTLLKATGSYTKKEQEVLLIMVHRFDKAEVMRIIKEGDPKAFVSVAKAEGVYGQNFEMIKL